jgi:hypothetical protein
MTPTEQASEFWVFMVAQVSHLIRSSITMSEYLIPDDAGDEATSKARGIHPRAISLATSHQFVSATAVSALAWDIDPC